jgi:hypothetical protein
VKTNIAFCKRLSRYNVEKVFEGEQNCLTDQLNIYHSVPLNIYWKWNFQLRICIYLYTQHVGRFSKI